VIQFLWVGFLERDTYLLYPNSLDPIKEGDELDCRASHFAAISAFVTQFSILGAELWFLVLTMDLHLAITNPFTSYKLNALRYHILVYGGSLGMGFVLLLAGDKVYGLSSDSSCWIQDVDGAKKQFPKVYFFYIFMIFIYAYCLYVVLFVFRRLKHGLSDTLKTRLSVVQRAQYYVLGYTFFWAFPLSLQFADFVLKDRSSHLLHEILQTSSATILASRGVFSLIILLLPNYTELKSILVASTTAESTQLAENIVKEESNQNPHLNIALRAEILYFTTQGIQFAVASAETERQAMGRPTSMSSHTLTLKSKSLDSKTNPTVQNAVASGAITEDPPVLKGVNREFSLSHYSRPVSMTRPTGSNSTRNSDNDIEAGLAIRELESKQRESVSEDIKLEENKIRSRFSLPPILRGFQDNSARKASVDVRERGESSASAEGKNPSAQFRLNFESGGDRNNWSRVSSLTKSDSTNTADSSLKKTLEGAVRTVPQDITFVDYLPTIFADVRAICNIDPDEYAHSFDQTTKEKFSEGRSGAFLYFSSNLKYIVKTTTESESKALQDIMEHYVEHIKKYPHSLICRFLGAHSVTLYGRTLYFVVMLNVFSGAEGFSERYDLKGSWVHRHGENSRRTGKPQKSAPLYKDNDLQFKISLLPGVEKAVTEQLARDTEFLRSMFLFFCFRSIVVLPLLFPL
jgi:hypothetical protein